MDHNKLWLRLFNFFSFNHHHGIPLNPRSFSTRKECEFREVFRRFDVNGDGKISGEELKRLFACMEDELREEEVEGVMLDLDSDGDGLLNFEDFMLLMKGGGDGNGDDEVEEMEKGDLRRAFQVYAGDGAITARGLKRVLGKLGEEWTQEDCEAMIRAYDLDENGEISFHEFCEMMR